MKYSNAFYNCYYYFWTIIFVSVLVVIRRSDATRCTSASTTTRKWQQQQHRCLHFDDNDNCTPRFNALGTIKKYFQYFQIKQISFSVVNVASRYPSQQQTHQRHHLLCLRGGADGRRNTGIHPQSVTKHTENDRFIVRNPTYQQPTPAVPVVTLGDIESSDYSARTYDDNYDDYNASKQKHDYGPKLRPIVAAYSFYSIQQFAYQWHRQYPILVQITLSCVLVFVMWHIRLGLLYNFMNQYFICRRSHVTIRNGKFISLLLSTISHIDIWHLVYNLMALLSLGPTVQSILNRKLTLSPTGIRIPLYLRRYHRHVSLSLNEAMWLLIIGAAMSGSISYLFWNEFRGIGSSGGGCLGLSTVTMSFLSVYASAYPHNILQFRIGGIIPIRLPAKQILLTACVGSIIGCILPILPVFKSIRKDNISHAGHLGGLIFGVVFYDIIIVNRSPLITFYNAIQRMITPK